MTGRCRLWPALLLLVVRGLAAPADARAQQFSYRGFADAAVTLYPQEAPNDSTQAVAEGQFRFDPSLVIRRGLSLTGSFEARLDTHDQTTERAEVTYWDRTIRRPTFAIRTVAATFSKGLFTIEAGKQFVRWGQSDILSPTDHFTPRDYLVTVSSEVLAPTAARVTVAGQSASVELVYTPRMTPSRMPLLDQRWIGLQASQAGLPLVDAGSDIPGGSQVGVRWHHITRRVEYSATLFQGFHHLALLDVTLVPTGTALQLRRRYPRIRAWGGDAVVPLPGITVRAEAAWLESRREENDDYGLWVLQVERQQGEWLFLGGYVGEWVTEERNVLAFAPDRGLAKGIVGRASYNFDSNRSVILESVTRRNGDGFYLKTEYSHGLGSHWRITLQALLIRGDEADFIGQFRRNSFVRPRARYSF